MVTLQLQVRGSLKMSFFLYMKSMCLLSTGSMFNSDINEETISAASLGRIQAPSPEFRGWVTL